MVLLGWDTDHVSSRAEDGWKSEDYISKKIDLWCVLFPTWLHVAKRNKKTHTAREKGPKNSVTVTDGFLFSKLHPVPRPWLQIFLSYSQRGIPTTWGSEVFERSTNGVFQTFRERFFWRYVDSNGFDGFERVLKCFTLPEHPETNIAPENRPSQKEIHLPTIHFQVLC